MKRARFVSVFSLLVLVVCVIYAGVFAASSIKDVQVGGSISIPANIINVSVEGFYGSKAVGTSDSPAYTSASGDTWTLSNTSFMTFDLSEGEVVADASNNPFTLTLRVTNNSDVALKCYFQNSGTTLTSQNFVDSSTTYAHVDVIGDDNGSGGNYNYILVAPQEDGSGSANVIKLQFTLDAVPESDLNFEFSYQLVITEPDA